MKHSVKFIAATVIVMVIVSLSAQVSDAKKKRRVSKSRKPAAESQSQQKSSRLDSLIGVWKGSGTGTGTDPRQPGADVSLNADDVKLTIESVKYSESSGEGRADVIFTGVITNVQGEIVCQRTWEYAVPYDMKREGENSWSFSTEFIDGEDKITLSFMPGNSALIRWEGFIADENYTDEKYTFDVTCSAEKN
ncbi:MAG: hypothetical protein IKQ95_10275 [Synergistaceae bacterium]|nr:hypothetical protein [Synergistaceae bacterium]